MPSIKSSKIFLDATQAMLFAQSLGQAAEAGSQVIENISKNSHLGAEELYSSILVHRPWGFVSNQFEIISAYQEAGVTHDAIVGYVNHIFNQKVLVTQTICEKFAQMEQKILNGIQAVLERDSELARDFKVWNRKRY